MGCILESEAVLKRQVQGLNATTIEIAFDEGLSLEHDRKHIGFAERHEFN